MDCIYNAFDPSMQCYSASTVTVVLLGPERISGVEKGEGPKG